MPRWSPDGTQLAFNSEPYPIPCDNQLDQNFPNPFTVSTSIRYSVGQMGHIRLQIMDLSGKRIVALVDEIRTPGLYSEIWDAKTSTGQPLEEGIYLYSLEGVDFTLKGKALFLRNTLQ